MSRTNIDNLQPQPRQLLADLIRGFVQLPGVLLEHETWHHSHEIGGQIFFGANFFSFHRHFIGKLEDHLRAQGATVLVPLPFWDPATPIPVELFHEKRVNSNPNKPLPSWATVAGGSTPSPVYGHTSLSQFRSVYELAIAIHDYHGDVHVTIGGLDGDMSYPAVSPLDPVFWPWHAFIDRVWETWGTISLREAARSVGLLDNVSILRDFFGNPPPPYQLSVTQGARDLFSNKS